MGRRPAPRNGAPAASSRPRRARRPLRGLSHQELLEMCLYEKEEAWVEFVHRFSRLVHSVLLRYDLEEEEREEAFQGTMMAAFRQLPRLRRPESLVSWLVGIAARQAVNRIRAARRETAMAEIDDSLLSASPARRPPAPAPDESLVQVEQGQQVREGFDLLPERCRRILQALFYEDPSPPYTEIARREGIPVGNIGSLRTRCIERLRSIFQARGWLSP